VFLIFDASIPSMAPLCHLCCRHCQQHGSPIFKIPISNTLGIGEKKCRAGPSFPKEKVVGEIVSKGVNANQAAIALAWTPKVRHRNEMISEGPGVHEDKKTDEGDSAGNSALVNRVVLNALKTCPRIEHETKR
jgi:hypothetical protein